MQSLTIPTHVAIIPDGNRRFATAHRLSILSGYKKGAEQFRNIMRATFSQGAKYLTFWAASEDNLKKRSKAEVKILITLLKNYAKELLTSSEVEEKEIQIKFIGRGVEIVQDKKLADLLHRVEEKTKNYQKHRLTVLFGYDGQQEMLAAAEKVKSKKEKLQPEDLKLALATGGLPPVDLVVRTGGEPHWSAGFMMWHTANSQFYFTQKLWPEFNSQELKKAFEDFARRSRRLGK